MKFEEAREQIVLIIDGSIAGEAEAILQSRHRFETRDRSTCHLAGLEAVDLGHVFLHPEMGALDTLLKMLGNIVNRAKAQEAIVDDRLDR